MPRHEGLRVCTRLGALELLFETAQRGDALGVRCAVERRAVGEKSERLPPTDDADEPAAAAPTVATGM